MHCNHLDIVSLDNGMYTVKNTVNSRYVKMGARETRFLLESIGFDNIAQEIDVCNELNADERELLFQKFEEWGFLDDKNLQQNNKKNDITRIKVCEFDPEKYIQNIPNGIKNMFSINGVILIAILTIIAFILMCNNAEGLYSAAKDSLHFSIMEYVLFYIMMVLTTMLHEMGHAICCTHHGGKISSIGIMLFFLIPCFFCDVSDIYMFKNRKKSFSVAVAGIAINYFMGTIVCIGYFILLGRGIYVPLLMFYYFANIGFVVFNLIPFVKLDGYWVVTALLEVDNLMDKSILTFLTCIINPREFKIIACGIVKKIVLFLYGLSAIAFRPIFWIVSVYSLCNFLAERQMDWMCGVVVGFVLVMVLKDVTTLLNRYIEMYRIQRHRVLGMI